MASRAKSNRVTVEAYTNLDWIDQGVPVELDREEWVENLIKAGYLRELPASEAKQAQAPLVEQLREEPTGGDGTG